MLSLKTLLRLVIEFWLYCSWKCISGDCTLQFHPQVIYNILHAHLTGRFSCSLALEHGRQTFFILVLPDSSSLLRFSCVLGEAHESPLSIWLLGFSSHRGVFKSSHPPKEYQVQWHSTLVVLWNFCSLCKREEPWNRVLFDVKNCNVSSPDTDDLQGSSVSGLQSLRSHFREREEW